MVDSGMVVVTVVLCIVIAVASVGISHIMTQEYERIFACEALGYYGYNQELNSCFNKGETIVLYPYENAFGGVE